MLGQYQTTHEVLSEIPWQRWTYQLGGHFCIWPSQGQEDSEILVKPGAGKINKLAEQPSTCAWDLVKKHKNQRAFSVIHFFISVENA